MKSSSISNRHSANHAAIGTRVTLRRILLGLSLLAPMVWLNSPMLAQEFNAAHAASHRASAYKRQSLDKRIQFLTKYLDLSDEQQSTLKNILLETQREMLKLRLAPSAGYGLQMDRFQAIEDHTSERIRGMLTKEQREKYDPLSKRESNSSTQKVDVENWLKGIGTQ